MGPFLPLVELVFPERCAACDAFVGEPGLCEACATSLYELGPACARCAEPFDAAVPQGASCRRCRVSPPPYRAVIAPWRYGGELATALRRMKYGRGDRTACRSIAALATHALRDLIASEPIDAIVPVPLARARLAARGFSQAHELARALRWPGAPPIEPGGLVRVRETREQAGLTRSERIRNVTGAFVSPRRAARRLHGRHVLLVDDVVTTGATAIACTRALQRAGAASVTVFAIARAEG